MISLPDHIPDMRRLYGFRALFALLLAIIALRLWFLQLVKGSELAEASVAQSVKLIRRVAPRGTIVDAKGRVLATSRPKYVVSASPDDVKKHPEILPRLALILHTDEQTLRDRVMPPPILLPSGKRVTLRGKPFDPVPLERDVSIEALSQIEEQRLDLPGVLVTRDPVRYYKDSALCAHLLGFTGLISYEQLTDPHFASYNGGDYVGKSGLESYYESELKGQDGGDEVAVDARGRMLRKQNEYAPQPGHTLRLSLDLDLQRAAYEELKAQYDGKNALHPGRHTGAVVALDPQSGEVLALASMPSYDSNTYLAHYNALSKDPDKPLFNRATSAAQAPGSPFKLVTAAAGLETGSVSQWTTYNCRGGMKIGNRPFGCDEVHHTTAFEKAIGASCNVYFYNVGLNVGPDALASWAGRFGLGKKTGIDLPSGDVGLVPSPAWKQAHVDDPAEGKWYPGETANMSIGQGGLKVTPLQLADYVAAIANGGTLWRPHLVHSILDVSQPAPVVVKTIAREARGKLGVKPENLRLIVSGMRHAMEKGGTAFASAVPGLDVAGKTGTVEIKNKKTRNSMFVCFAPIDHPKIALAILVDGGGYGSETAAPIGRRLLAQYFHIKLPPTQTAVAAHD